MKKPGRIHWDEQADAAANARRELPPLVAAYFADGREWLAKAPSVPELHHLRLASKQLRYTLELFRPCYGPGLESRLNALRRLQQSLGEVNDHVATAHLLSQCMAASPLRARILARLDRQAAAGAREFRKHWREVFDAPGQEAWWTGYLARHTRNREKR